MGQASGRNSLFKIAAAFNRTGSIRTDSIGTASNTTPGTKAKALPIDPEHAGFFLQPLSGLAGRAGGRSGGLGAPVKGVKFLRTACVRSGNESYQLPAHLIGCNSQYKRPLE